MRSTDLARLSQPYVGERPEGEPLQSLGVDTPVWRQLIRQVFDDFIEEQPYGVSWWAPKCGTKARILIGDHLYACLVSVTDNLTEAALHRLDFIDYREMDAARFADAVQPRGGRLTIEAIPSRHPLDDLIDSLIRMHAAGVVRALAGAFDCLASVVIGVIALPKKIFRAGFKDTRTFLADRPLHPRQYVFREAFERIIAESGPEGWLDWMLEFRNMLVHRGRRIEHGQFRSNRRSSVRVGSAFSVRIAYRTFRGILVYPRWRST